MVVIKKRKGNLPPNPLALLVMMILLGIMSIHAYLYPQAFLSNENAVPPNVIPNALDWIFWGLISIIYIVIAVNVAYSFYVSLRYGGP
jgi:RsiW-degrading membrane proteinase PrsW (M82 family)